MKKQDNAKHSPYTQDVYVKRKVYNNNMQITGMKYSLKNLFSYTICQFHISSFTTFGLKTQLNYGGEQTLIQHWPNEQPIDSV